MLSSNSARIGWMMFILIGLMAATRFHHEGTPFALADASLAVFFLGGLYLNMMSAFLVLLASACVIDYTAIAHLGVSDYCISPAYFFLAPTYLVMWHAGCRSRKYMKLNRDCALKLGFVLVGAVSMAFILSNGSFFVFSGRYEGMDWADYVFRVSRDYPNYLGAVLIYCILVFVCRTLIGTKWFLEDADKPLSKGSQS